MKLGIYISFYCKFSTINNWPSTLTHQSRLWYVIIKSFHRIFDMPEFTASRWWKLLHRSSKSWLHRYVKFLLTKSLTLHCELYKPINGSLYKGDRAKAGCDVSIKLADHSPFDSAANVSLRVFTSPESVVLNDSRISFSLRCFNR